jgi:hypothetical protein
MMKGCVLIVLAFTAWCTNAQNIQKDTIPATAEVAHKDQRPLKEKISLGGSTAFWIQPSRTHVELSAFIAYRFPKTLTVGPGYRYVYTRNRVYGKDLNSYGPNIFARAQLTKRIYLWTEWEYLKTEYVTQVAGNEIISQTDYVDSFYAGAGYIRKVGRKGRGGISFQLLYNFLYNREDNTPYYSPVIYRIGYFL